MRSRHPGSALSDQALEYMRRQYRKNLRVAQIARGLGCSATQLRAELKRRHGCGVAQALRQTRIVAAKRLLRMTARSVKDVALSTGFSNYRSFVRAFRRETGRSPTQYRASVVDSGAGSPGVSPSRSAALHQTDDSRGAEYISQSWLNGPSVHNAECDGYARPQPREGTSPCVGPATLQDT